MKFILIGEHKLSKAEELINEIYKLYSDYVLKNPFYSVDMPIRYGECVCVGGVVGVNRCTCVVGEWVCVWLCINKYVLDYICIFNDVNTIALVLSLKKFKIQKRTSNLPACCQTLSKIYDNMP